MIVTSELARFAYETRYEDLPAPVIRESKRLLLDALGCVVGGLKTRKGELGVRMARALGGGPQAILPGTAEKVSMSASAYAIGELMNALDYEALLSPPDHATPYLLAAILAAADGEGVTGKDLVAASAVAHEMAIRVAAGLVFGSRFNVEVPGKGVTIGLPTPGYGLCVFGGTAAAGKLMGLSREQITHAMGIAGYHAPLPMLMKFCMTVPAGLPKYLSSGILSQMEIMAAMAAKMGCTGDPEVLDGAYGFWRAFGCEGWRPEIVSQGLGEVWYFPDRIFYKTFPCCGAMQNGLSLFQKLMTDKALHAEEIMELHVKLNLLAELPAWRAKEVANHVDAQFNVPFVFSLVANKVEVGPLWQSEETLRDPRIVGFTKRVRVWTELDATSCDRPDIEAVVGSDSRKKIYEARGAAASDMDEDLLLDKFFRNTKAILGNDSSRRVSEMILHLEAVEDVRDLTALLSGAQSGFEEPS